jgi:hypothetical protein
MVKNPGNSAVCCYCVHQLEVVGKAGEKDLFLEFDVKSSARNSKSCTQGEAQVGTTTADLSLSFSQRF